jgi:integrase
MRSGPTKTKGSRRTISLPQTLVEELAAHLAEFGTGPEGVIVSSPQGSWVRASSWRQRFWNPAVEASVGRPFRFHDLRHTHAAFLIAQGAHAKAIQSRLGHSSIVVTMDTYGHLMPEIDEGLADMLDADMRDAHQAAEAHAVART